MAQWNGPFAAGDHMLQTPPYWRANCALGHLKRNINFLCSICPSVQFALQYGGVCTM